MLSGQGELEVENIMRSQAGQYQCVATETESGDNSNSTVDVTVQCEWGGGEGGREGRGGGREGRGGGGGGGGGRGRGGGREGGREENEWSLHSNPRSQTASLHTPD